MAKRKKLKKNLVFASQMFIDFPHVTNFDFATCSNTEVSHYSSKKYCREVSRKEEDRLVCRSAASVHSTQDGD